MVNKMDYLDEYFDEIYNIKTYQEIKNYKLEKYKPICEYDRHRTKEKSREITTYHVLNIYLNFRKIKLWVKKLVTRSV
jgi:hypothetical protein